MRIGDPFTAFGYVGTSSFRSIVASSVSSFRPIRSSSSVTTLWRATVGLIATFSSLGLISFPTFWCGQARSSSSQLEREGVSLTWILGVEGSSRNFGVSQPFSERLRRMYVCVYVTIKVFYKRNWNCEKIWLTWKRMSIACSWSSWVFSSFVSYYSINLIKFIFIQLFYCF